MKNTGRILTFVTKLGKKVPNDPTRKSGRPVGMDGERDGRSSPGSEKREVPMEFKILTYVAALTVFAVQIATLQSAAQDRQGHGHAGYTVTNLGTLGGTLSDANGISNNGWITGIANLAGDQSTHATLWRKREKPQDLGTLGGPNSSVNWPVKDERGVIVGVSDTSTTDPLTENFCGDDTGLMCMGFVWQSGVMSPLPTLGGNNSYAFAANNRGQVAGLAENSTQDPNCVAPQVFDWEAVIWGPKPGEIHELNPWPGDAVGGALAINDEGQVAGGSLLVCGPLSEGSAHALLWETDGTLIDLGNLGGATGNLAKAMNNRGDVVGESDLKGDNVSHAFFWTKDKGMQDLGTLPGDVSSFALGINNRGEVVGSSCDANGNCRAFLWTQEEGMQDLNTLVCSGTSLYLTNADGGDINDRGEIVGQAYDPNTGKSPAYLAVPTHGKGHCEVGPSEKVILPENARQWSQERGRMGPRSGAH